MKQCSICKEVKPLTDFHKNHKAQDGRRYDCKACRKAESLKQYGLTMECYDKLVELQGNQCAVCGTTEPRGTSTLNRWYVDHNHQTDEVRGLLCSPCNTGLGNFYDNADTLRRAADYLDDRGSYANPEETRQTPKEPS